MIFGREKIFLHDPQLEKKEPKKKLSKKILKKKVQIIYFTTVLVI